MSIDDRLARRFGMRAVLILILVMISWHSIDLLTEPFGFPWFVDLFSLLILQWVFRTSLVKYLAAAYQAGVVLPTPFPVAMSVTWHEADEEEWWRGDEEPA
jgi:hypothetical protein